MQALNGLRTRLEILRFKPDVLTNVSAQLKVLHMSMSIIRVNRAQCFFFLFLWQCSLAVPVLAGWIFAFCGSMSRNSGRLNRQWFLVLKRLRRCGNSLKSHPTDWEKPGIEPATPGLHNIGLSPTQRRHNASFCFCGHVPWL